MTFNLFNRVALLVSRRSLIVVWNINGFTDYRELSL